MRDGVRLAAVLYHPDGKGPWPCIVNRLPYGHKSVKPMAKYFAGAGYAFLAQDTRGRYRSEGGSDTFYPFVTEENDGRDTLDWVKKQSWCNGKIATWGLSYHGYTQWALAPGNPDVDAIAPLIITSNAYRFFYTNGAENLETCLVWGVKNLRRKKNILAGHLKRGYRHLPLIEADNVARDQWPFFDDMLAHPIYDEFWKPMDFSNRISEINVPALFVSGWYDVFNTGQLRDFQSWQARGPDAPKARLIVGPWNHHFYNTSLKNVEWSWKDAVDNVLKPSLLWFDRWLKGIENGIDSLKPVHVYVMGENNWRDFDTWPPDGTQAMNFYLSSSGDANSVNGKGRLSTEAPQADEPPDSFGYDPLNPVPTKGGAGMLPWKAGPTKQNKVEKRSDVLVYSTETFNEPLVVIGSVSVKLFAATSAVDTDFTAKLVDVYPNGKALIVTDGILRGRYREGGEAKMLTPGEIYEWNIDLGYTALKINPGHLIRLEISSSNFPRYNRNLNTGENIATDTQTVIAHQKVFHSAQYPSRLILNILKE